MSLENTNNAENYLKSYHPENNPYSQLDIDWLAKKRQIMIRTPKSHDGFVSITIADEIICFYAGTRKAHSSFMVGSYHFHTKAMNTTKDGEPLQRGIYILKNDRNEIFFILTKTEKSLSRVRINIENSVKRALDQMVKEGSTKYKKIISTFKSLNLTPGELFPTGETSTTHKNCDLCGTILKEAYEVSTHDHKKTLLVGNECVIQQTALGGDHNNIKDSLVSLKIANKKNVYKKMPYFEEGRRALYLSKLEDMTKRLRRQDYLRKTQASALLLRGDYSLKSFLKDNLSLTRKRKERLDSLDKKQTESKLKRDAKRLMALTKDGEQIRDTFTVESIFPYKNKKGYVVNLLDSAFRKFVLFLNNDNKYLSIKDFQGKKEVKGTFKVIGRENTSYNGQIYTKNLKGFFNKAS